MLTAAVARVAHHELGLEATAQALLGYIEYPSHLEAGLDWPVGMAFRTELAAVGTRASRLLGQKLWAGSPASPTKCTTSKGLPYTPTAWPPERHGPLPRQALCPGWSTGLAARRACDAGGPRSPPAWPAGSSRSASARASMSSTTRRQSRWCWRSSRPSWHGAWPPGGPAPGRARSATSALTARPSRSQYASCDAALSTFTLCTVADPAKVLTELRRVLRSEGRFHFLEHGIAPEASVAKWQRRLDPGNDAWQTAATSPRDTLALVGQAGFIVERYEQGYAAGPKPWSYFTMGVAVNRA